MELGMMSGLPGSALWRGGHCKPMPTAGYPFVTVCTVPAAALAAPPAAVGLRCSMLRQCQPTAVRQQVPQSRHCCGWWQTAAAALRARGCASASTHGPERAQLPYQAGVQGRSGVHISLGSRSTQGHTAEP